MKKLLIAAASVVALSSPAFADFERHGWYVGLEAGYSIVDSHSSFDTVTGSAFDFDDGYGALGTVGGMIAPHWRLEMELGYRRNEFNDFSAGQSGALREITGMMNVAWDHPVADRWRISVGAGAGIDYASIDYGSGPAKDDWDYGFAYQGLLELVYQASDKMDVFLGYRYLGADGLTFNDHVINPCIPAASCPVELEMDAQKHLISIGFRYGFTQPAPVVVPPVEVPPPAAPKQFIIFFGFNKCNITAEADAVLSEAASAAKAGNAASIRVVGHTDSVGSDSYNQKLSECRANAAKDNLVGKGISDSAISTSGKGESELMVQTGDNVKEPQNRRATIDLQ